MHKSYKIMTEDYQNIWECIEGQSAEDAVYWISGEKVRLVDIRDGEEWYSNAGQTKTFIVREIKQVCLTFKQISKMVEYMCNVNPIVRSQLTSDYMENLLVDAIRYVTRIDFTEEIDKKGKE